MRDDEDDAPPPILGTWRRLYALVLIVLVAQVVLYWLLTRIYS
jgi:hypothetical protein